MSVRIAGVARKRHQHPTGRLTSPRLFSTLPAATSGWSRKVNRWSRTLPYRLRKR
jgi:hypothetical protein